MEKGFTLVELLVVIAIIVILSGIILYSVTQYINKGKDANISGNLAVLIPAGEVFYTVENGAYNDGYNGFCDPSKNSVIKNAVLKMPQNSSGDCLSGLTPGVCCYVATPYYDSWAACAKEFTNNAKALCVDSRGVQEEIDNSYCLNTLNTTFKCP